MKACPEEQDLRQYRTAVFTYPEYFEFFPELRERTGSRVIIQKTLTTQDDPRIEETLHEVRFPDGYTHTVFDSELSNWR